MYEATEKERAMLIESDDVYTDEVIAFLEIESDNIRKGIPVAFSTAMVVTEYQSDLRKIRKSLKKWWQFWK